MKKHRLNAIFLIGLIFFGGLAAGVIWFLYQDLTGQILDEDGESLGRTFEIIIAVLFGIVGSSYLYTFITMAKQYILHGGQAFELTERGIENTMVYIYVLAFFFVIPVKCIPWEAVKYVCPHGKGYEATIDIKKVKASWPVRLVLFTGYGFCHKFTKPKITEEELRLYGIKIKASFLDD